MELITNYFNTDEVRSFVDDKGVSWFHGTHVCQVLEYANPSVTIPANVDECDRQKVDLGGLNSVWFVNKPGLYDLILACKKPVAKPFHKWLSHNLLPALDEKGYYISRKDEATLAALQTEINELKTQLVRSAKFTKVLTDGEVYNRIVEMYVNHCLVYSLGLPEEYRQVPALDGVKFLQLLDRHLKGMQQPKGKRPWIRAGNGCGDVEDALLQQLPNVDLRDRLAVTLSKDFGE